MSQSNHYIRADGKVYGPVTLEQLSDLAARGKLHPEDEISEDRVSWYPAARMGGLFAAHGEGVSDIEALVSTRSGGSGGTDTHELWYAVLDGRQSEPMSRSELVQLYRQGGINDQTMVYGPGMTDWKPYWQATMLASHGPAAQESSTAHNSPSAAYPGRFHTGPTMGTGRAHRGGTILTLGILSIVTSLLCAIVAVILGLIAVLMATSDFKSMDAGLMDASGRSQTTLGRLLAIIGVGLSAINILISITFFVLSMP
ncbi:MAG: DUF4339 domain-containing protein [Phycisphaeraceae bacterium]|nr:DUF4339 domain-containing protein [Phycisphaeraceae bacterium]